MKAERKSRSPRREYPKQDGVGTDVYNGLYGNSPVSPAMVGTTDTCNTRNEDGGYLYLTTLFYHEITEKVSRRGSTETSLFNTLKDIAPYLIISVAVMTFTYWVAGYVKNIYLSLLVKVALAASLYIFLMWSLKSIVFRESLQYLFKKKTIQ